MERTDADHAARIDAAIEAWRQGDCVVGSNFFAFRILPSSPITSAAEEAAAEDCDLAESEVSGFVVVTQTCDIVRACNDRPFVEVCPLVEVESEMLAQIERHMRPRYAWVPGTAELGLVADLDRVMTVEKAVVASWDRVEGCSTERQARSLAKALARKRERMAFPEDFVSFASPLMKRIRDKHSKMSDEGMALRALLEVRVRAAPSWHAEEVQLTFLFLRQEQDPGFRTHGWHHHLEEWMKLVSARERFSEVDGFLVTLADLTAQEYVESDPCDLDSLSTKG